MMGGRKDPLGSVLWRELVSPAGNSLSLTTPDAICAGVITVNIHVIITVAKSCNL